MAERRAGERSRVTGSVFERIHRVIRRVPHGKIATYGEVAQKANVSVRTVVWSLRNCPQNVPWHRVVGKGGKILLGWRSPLLGAEQADRLSKEGWTVREWIVSRGKDRKRKAKGRRQKALSRRSKVAGRKSKVEGYSLHG